MYELLRNGKIKVHTPDVGKDRLKGASEGLDEMRAGMASGESWFIGLQKPKREH